MKSQEHRSSAPTSDTEEQVLGRLHHVRDEIARAAKASGRAPEDVTLVIASKTQSPERLEPILRSGHRVFGENRVQEAAAKWPALRSAYPGLELRLIGPLQSNKAKEAVALFDVIETLDRPSLAQAIGEQIGKQGRSPRLYVEVNTGDEPQKAGVGPKEADAFIRLCRETYGLNISGLMCVPPLGEQASPHFALLAQIAKRNGVSDLSMGMTADFPLAIQLGATHVRIGSAIFGSRSP